MIDRLSRLAEAVADRRTLDWDALESSASDDAELASIRRLRAIAVIGFAHSELTLSHSLSESLSVRTQLQGVVERSTPATWGPLRILERVGRGRFGDVYRAWDPNLDRVVALKLHRHRDSGAHTGDREVVEEGRLMARVRHPNVVTIHGAQRIDGRVGLWMEFVEGRTLEAELRQRGRLAAEEVAHVGVELCRALTAVHDAGLVHRDVKAQNVLRDRRGQLLLGDFGTGRELAEERETPGNLAGTPSYLAPEIFGGAAATAQSDIYSLGVLLFHLSTGDYPVRGRSVEEIRNGHLGGHRLAIHALRPELPAALVTIIERALSAKPDLRFDSARAMELALASCLTEPAARGSIRSWQRPLPVVVALGIVAVAAVMTVRGPDLPPRRLDPDPSRRTLSTTPVQPGQNRLEPATTDVPEGAAAAVAALNTPSHGSTTANAEEPPLLPPAFIGDDRARAIAAQDHLRRGEIAVARRYVALIALNDEPAGIGSRTWRLGFEMQATWQELDAAGAVKATDTLAPLTVGNADWAPSLVWSYVSLGRLRDAERIAAAIPPQDLRQFPSPMSREGLLAMVFEQYSDPTRLRELLTSAQTVFEMTARAKLLLRAGLLDEAERTINASKQLSARPNPMRVPVEAELAIVRHEPVRARELLTLVHGFDYQIAPEQRGQVARVWHALGETERAIETLNNAVDRHRAMGSGVGHWLATQALLARLLRSAGRVEDARPIEDELRKLLAVADDDHPIVLQLRATN